MLTYFVCHILNYGVCHIEIINKTRGALDLKLGNQLKVAILRKLEGKLTSLGWNILISGSFLQSKVQRVSIKMWKSLVFCNIFSEKCTLLWLKLFLSKCLCLFKFVCHLAIVNGLLWKFFCTEHGFFVISDVGRFFRTEFEGQVSVKNHLKFSAV